jgi:transposase
VGRCEKKLRRLRGRLICLDETGFLMTPVVRRTWSLRGQTPQLAVRQRRHRKVSGIGALAVSPKRRSVALFLKLHADRNVRGPEVLMFLRHLRRHNPGPIVLLWDRGNPHKHKAVREYLEAHPQWHVVWLPPYAPELNPQEQVWSYLKYGRLANFAPSDIDDICREVRRETANAQRRPSLLKALLRHSILPFRVPS